MICLDLRDIHLLILLMLPCFLRLSVEVCELFFGPPSGPRGSTLRNWEGARSEERLSTLGSRSQR